MRAKLKELTSRSNGWGYEKRKFKLREYIQGWIGYFWKADMKSLLKRVDEWLRRRIRMCIWKSWKRARTKYKNLIKCGIPKQKAYEWSNTRKSYWHTSNSWILSTSITNARLQNAGYPSLMVYYRKYYRS